MRALIAIVAMALWSGAGMAGTCQFRESCMTPMGETVRGVFKPWPKAGSDPVTPYVCRPALTWDDLSVTFDRACIKAGGAKRMTRYQAWAYGQLEPDQPYFKPVTNLCDTSSGQPVPTECNK